jgi:hypothetical protein
MKAFKEGQKDAANGEVCRFAKFATRKEMTEYIYGYNSISGKNIKIDWLTA